MRKFIPPGIKRNARLTQRFIKDLSKGNLGKFAKTDRYKIAYEGMVEIRQEIKPSDLFENKVHNIKLGASKIQPLQILPGEILSFWKAIGNPTQRNGFKPGRNIVQGVLTEQVGGGLCQLAGIMYHTSLKADLDPVERHPHSIDIYQEHERYTPLGADAAVVYGYKDLRIKNTRGFPIKYTFLIQGNELICRIFTEGPIFSNKVDFSRKVLEGGKEEVTTFITDETGEKKELSRQLYAKMTAG